MTEEPKCKDCKWLTGKKNIRGIECMNPKNQEKWNKAKTLWMGELRKDTARYKQRNAPACKRFEIKGSEQIKDELIYEDGDFSMIYKEGSLTREDIEDLKRQVRMILAERRVSDA